MELTIDIPEDIVSILRMEPEQFSRELRLAAAVKWYELRLISQDKAAEIAGISRDEFLRALGQFGVSGLQSDDDAIIEEETQERDDQAAETEAAIGTGESTVVKMAYPAPVDRLLTFGSCLNFHEWPNYLDLGLGPAHIPDLIRMATDEELHWAAGDSLEVWAPIHAWRALGQLRAKDAIGPLTRLFHELEENDWVSELTTVYGMIGPAAIPALSTYLADRGHGMYPRVYAAESLEKIGSQHPDARAECVAILTHQLERFDKQNPTLNALLIGLLEDLQAVESVPVIERAFAADCVDVTIVGDWDDVQVELGLKEADATAFDPSWLTEQSLRVHSGLERLSSAPPQPQSKTERNKAKAKRKQGKHSHRKHHKRKK